MIGRKVSLDELNEYLKNLNMERSVHKVIIHHFWRPKASDWKGFETLQSVYNYHAHEKGWSDIGYHIVIGPDDTIWLGRPAEAVGAHTIGQNEHSIGIAYAADFDTEEPKHNGYDTGIAVCAAVMKRFGLGPEDIFFHRDFADKSCPGLKMDRKGFRNDVAALFKKRSTRARIAGR